MFGWIRSLFAPGTPRPPIAPARDVVPLIDGLDLPALRLQCTATPSRSWLAGDPQLPTGTEWPRGNRSPLPFLARLSLAELQAALPTSWLPQTGALLFFHDNTHWGRERGDRACFAVLHVDDLPAPVAHVATIGTGRRQRTVPANVAFHLIQTLPPFQDPRVEALDLDDEEADAYIALQDLPFGNAPHHQACGYDNPVQVGGMQVDCDEMANGRTAPDPQDAARRWALLLQIDEDEALGFRWGDAGRLYFWVEPERAVRGDFSNCWRVLQCC